ncbi:hypothetical protein BHM03_00054081 [Ensete ventricosum]|nr:hypothetical protein BHM03_00054081 [Ensete ventricosum]
MGGQPRPGLLQGGGWLWPRSPAQGAVGYDQLAGAAGACWHDRLLRGARMGGRLQGGSRKGQPPTARPQGATRPRLGRRGSARRGQAARVGCPRQGHRGSDGDGVEREDEDLGHSF